MKMVRCDADMHRYDADKYSSCPLCRATVFALPDDEEEELEPIPPVRSEYRPSVTQYIGQSGKIQIPVVGWLVIMASPKNRDGLDSTGSDYRLIPGNNRVGRSSQNEVTIDVGDDMIGRDAHCVITYDTESDAFYILPGEGRNLTYVYDGYSKKDEKEIWTVVLAPRELNHLDRVKIGDTVLIFCPLCSTGYRWDFKK